VVREVFASHAETFINCALLQTLNIHSSNSSEHQVSVASVLPLALVNPSETKIVWIVQYGPEYDGLPGRD